MDLPSYIPHEAGGLGATSWFRRTLECATLTQKRMSNQRSKKTDSAKNAPSSFGTLFFLKNIFQNGMMDGHRTRVVVGYLSKMPLSDLQPQFF